MSKFKGPTKEQIAKARQAHAEFEALIASLPMSDAIASAPTVGVDEHGVEEIMWSMDFLGEQREVKMTRRYAVRTEYCEAERAKLEAKKIRLTKGRLRALPPFDHNAFKSSGTLRTF